MIRSQRYIDVAFRDVPIGVAFTIEGRSSFSSRWKQMRFMRASGGLLPAVWLHDARRAMQILGLPYAPSGYPCYFPPDRRCWIRVWGNA